MTAVASSARDGELLRALHDEHAAALWSHVTGLLHGDRVRAQDVVQETLLRAWRDPAAVTAAATPRGWLFTVAKRIVIDAAIAENGSRTSLGTWTVAGSKHTTFTSGTALTKGELRAIEITRVDGAAVLSLNL